MVKLRCWILLVAAAPLVAEEAPSTGARLLREWAAGNAPVRAVRFLTNDTSIAVDISGFAATLDEGVKAFPRTSWPGLTFAAVLPDAVAFVGLANGEVWRWDLETRKCERASSRHGSTVACAVVSPDGRLLATGS